MKPTLPNVWLPVVFCAVLSAIAMVTYVASGLSGAWIPAFVCFMPMAFWFAAISNQKTREQIQAMQARIDDLERR